LQKEIDLVALAAALRGCRGTVLILQRLPREGDVAGFRQALGRVAHDLSSLNDELVDMAALLFLMDEYVAVSNTNVHIRAAVGKAARVLVPFPPEFRWMHVGDHSPWFPSSSVYRQSENRGWQRALDALVGDLNQMNA
jgi:hypothetical protein